MVAGTGRFEGRATAMRWARHVLCVVALMWTGLVNGQPFFFQSDTTNYIRAADVAVYVASKHRFSTVWTDRYREQLPNLGKAEAAPAVANSNENLNSANSIGHGLIMGGRSPYIGALMYIGYVLGDFWPFILLQAAVAYALILLTARRFGVTDPVRVTALTLGLAATTSLPTYNSLLLADAFASFGILAFLLLATPGKLSKVETAFVGLVLCMSVISHLTHEMMLGGMLAVLALIAVLRWPPRPPKRAWGFGIACLIIGAVSVTATSVATRLALGSSPQMLPLLSARFIADGPGKAYIDSGCDGRRFEICRIPIGRPDSDALILFGTTPQTGGYMLANADQRRTMGQEDIAFAVAVLKFDFPGEAAMIARNTVRQLVWIDYDGLNQDCFKQPDCWESLPAPVREKLKQTPSGRGEWPQQFMNIILYAVALSSLAYLAVASPKLRRDDPARWQVLRTWLVVGFGAMLVCALFGGAVADPQYRYEGRLIWLVPLMAGILLLIRGRPGVKSPAVETIPGTAAAGAR